MKDAYIFRRIEKKYRLSGKQQAMLMTLIGERLMQDEFGHSTVCSLYLDTPDNLLIRNSIDAISYKEKLRLRSYGTPSPDSQVFLELKKKYDGVVYKRRVSMTLSEAERYLETGEAPFDSQIMREIDYAMRFYNRPKPSMFIAYEREAFVAREDGDLRLTFDSAVRYRTSGLRLENGTPGKAILPEDTYLLEIKTTGAMPLWLSHALDECAIRPSSFSKYGAAYQDTLTVREPVTTKGENQYACNF